MNNRALMFSIFNNDYHLSCSAPLTDIRNIREQLSNYTPYKEEHQFTLQRVHERLDRWEKDLILGKCKK